MSNWTYVNGIITVSPLGRTQSEKTYILETVIEHLPKVTGSEEDMNITILQRKGYDMSSSHNEFEINAYYLNSEHWIKTQTDYFLILDGNLRDKTFQETFKELNIFLNRLAKRVLVNNILLSLNEDWGKKFVFKDAEPYSNMFEPPSWSYNNKTGEPSWAEYLMWKRGANSPLPIELEYKYYDNKENDKEWKRRVKWDKEFS